MERVETVLDVAIEATAQSFLQTPANYSDERALAEEVRPRVCSVPRGSTSTWSVVSWIPFIDNYPAGRSPRTVGLWSGGVTDTSGNTRRISSTCTRNAARPVDRHGGPPTTGETPTRLLL
jgi:hypothetical protein